MERIPWILTDASTAETYAFEINPNADGSLQYEKTITYKNTSSPTGVTVVFEGRNVPSSTQFSGKILSQAQYDAMVYWFGKKSVVTIQDDLGRIFNIYVTKFSPKRERSVLYPWKHSYTVDYFIIN